MQRLTGIMLFVAVASAALAGCALRDERDYYTRGGGSDGLWNNSFDIIDWNFPTSHNQGPIERPERIRLEPTAIGVTWATRNPIPLNDELPTQDGPAVSSNDGAPVGVSASPSIPASAGAQARESASPAGAAAGLSAAARERNGAR